MLEIMERYGGNVEMHQTRKNVLHEAYMRIVVRHDRSSNSGGEDFRELSSRRDDDDDGDVPRLDGS